MNSSNNSKSELLAIPDFLRNQQNLADEKEPVPDAGWAVVNMDLVERLRVEHSHGLSDDAANEIERLDAEAQRWADRFEKQKAEVARLERATTDLSVIAQERYMEIERLRKALNSIKALVVGAKHPNWADDRTYATRVRIADLCDIALGRTGAHSPDGK